MKELKTDSELKNLLPPLTDDEYGRLEKSILENGFDRNFPIMEWHGYIADGHNRYSICKKYKIEPIIGTLAYDTKEEVMEWMLDIQLGRRNLSPIQRIAVAERYRPIYEKQAKENQGTRNDLKNNITVNLPQSPKKQKRNPTTDKKLSDIATVSEKTYQMGAKVLHSDNEDVKQRVLSGETSISAGYKEIMQNKKNKDKRNINKEVNTDIVTHTMSSANQPQISEEVKQICADLKTEKTKEYLDSIWNYRIDFIECMNADAEMFFDTLRSHFGALNNLVTEKELKECVNAAKKVSETINQIIKQAEMSTKIKLEDNKHVN